MRYLFIGVFFLGTISIFAQSSGPFFYTTGTDRGKTVLHTGYIGYDEICYKGNPWRARAILKKMFTYDFEKDKARVWYYRKDESLRVRFVSIKCMDDRLNAKESECTIKVRVPRCQ